MNGSQVKFNKIILPVRPQPDTIVAVFLLKRYGEEKFPGIKGADIDFVPLLPENKTTEDYRNEGVVLIDLGGGEFDHHSKSIQTTASDLVSSYLEISDDPAISKLLEYARRDDFYGKGTISNDPIDRAFGLSALVTALNKSLPNNPKKVIDIVTPLIIAHHNEEKRRYEDFPKEVEEKRAQNKAQEFVVKQHKKKLKVIAIESNNVGLSGFLRSQMGGRYDVIVQKNSNGHVNILTRPTKRVDLRKLVALIRLAENSANGIETNANRAELMMPGRFEGVKNWYYDTATNSILNGGTVSQNEIEPTKIEWKKLVRIVGVGLADDPEI